MSCFLKKGAAHFVFLNMAKTLLFLCALITLTTLYQCGNDNGDLFLPEIDESLSGGTGTIFSASPSAFSFQDPNLSQEDGLFFFTGNSLFNQNWVTAPASTTARDGLGPLFNARSCSGCHFKDGRGRAPEYPGERVHGLLLRLSVGNDPEKGPIPDPNYGGQLQDLSVLGINTEADFIIDYEDLAGTFPDGNSYNLRKPTYTLLNLKEGPLQATKISPRVAPQMIGLGLLDAVAENTLLSMADEFDENGDGISGRPNYVWNVEAKRTTLGRFGWKANQPNIRQQVAGAFSGDMGLTSSIFPDHNCPPSENCDSLPNGGAPEVSDVNFDKVVLYSSSLAVPGRRNWEEKNILQGKELFVRAQCANCHTPKLTTGTYPENLAFSKQTIRPYTDLLLHDMGDGLSDNSEDYLASGSEWRTPPLWGIGLFEIVNGHTFYLHDGRARNLEEAILWHGGEAAVSQTLYKQMTKKERDLLIDFLNSL